MTGGFRPSTLGGFVLAMMTGACAPEDGRSTSMCPDEAACCSGPAMLVVGSPEPLDTTNLVHWLDSTPPTLRVELTHIDVDYTTIGEMRFVADEQGHFHLPETLHVEAWDSTIENFPCSFSARLTFILATPQTWMVEETPFCEDFTIETTADSSEERSVDAWDRLVLELDWWDWTA